MIGIIYDKKFLCFCNVINNFKKIRSVLIISLVVSVYIGYRNIGKKLYRCNTSIYGTSQRKHRKNTQLFSDLRVHVSGMLTCLDFRLP